MEEEIENKEEENPSIATENKEIINLFKLIIYSKILNLTIIPVENNANEKQTFESISKDIDLNDSFSSSYNHENDENFSSKLKSATLDEPLIQDLPIEISSLVLNLFLQTLQTHNVFPPQLNTGQNLAIPPLNQWKIY